MYYSNKGSVLIFILIVFSIVSTITMMCIGLNYSNSRINNLNYQNIVMKESLLSSIELVHSNILKEVSIAPVSYTHLFFVEKFMIRQSKTTKKLT